MVNWERLFYISGIGAAAVAAITFILATVQFASTQTHERETINLERQVKAVELFVRYNELMREAATQRTPESAQATEWRRNLSMALIESIWNLTHEDSTWVATVRSLLTTEDQLHKIDDLECSTYDSTFVTLARTALNHNVCVAP